MNFQLKLDEDGTDEEVESAEEEEDVLELHGTQAKIHHPLQNHDQDYLSNFITQMYQTTEVQKNVKTLKNQLEMN